MVSREDYLQTVSAEQKEYAEVFDYRKITEKSGVITDYWTDNLLELHSFCTGRFGITFPQFAKNDVNGENAIPLYKWLTTETKFEGFGKSPMALMLNGVVKKMDKDYKNNGNVKWNFTKFLIDREGNIVSRFEPTDMKNLKEKNKECL